MTTKEIRKRMEAFRAQRDEAVLALQNRLQKEADDLTTMAESSIDELLASEGKMRCGRCGGHGAVERLDSGYMRRFDLREWNGCESCGGDGHEKKGCGFITRLPK